MSSTGKGERKSSQSQEQWGPSCRPSCASGPGSSSSSAAATISSSRSLSPRPESLPLDSRLRGRASPSHQTKTSRALATCAASSRTAGQRSAAATACRQQAPMVPRRRSRSSESPASASSQLAASPPSDVGLPSGESRGAAPPRLGVARPSPPEGDRRGRQMAPETAWRSSRTSGSRAPQRAGWRKTWRQTQARRSRKQPMPTAAAPPLGRSAAAACRRTWRMVRRYTLTSASEGPGPESPSSSSTAPRASVTTSGAPWSAAARRSSQSAQTPRSMAGTASRKRGWTTL
mmetsp:Transcript_124225/g.362620  ORF Transcript_124225/g.362620 Transcript_124225/m.362620 type:complete len:289 (-) Transcript_124225:1088-1954(-)